MAGCVSAPKSPPALTAPPVLAETRNYSGTPLSGPQAADSSSFTSSGALSIKVTFFALEKMPAASSEPLGPHLRLIVANREDSPVLASARLTLGVRLIELPDAEKMLADVKSGTLGRSVLISTLEKPLVPGATVAFGVSEPPTQSGSASDLTNRRLELEFCLPPGAVNVSQSNTVATAILMEDFLDLSPPAEIEQAFIENAPPPTSGRNSTGSHRRETPPPPPPAFQSELGIFDRPDNRNSFALVAPIHFRDTECQAVIAIVQIQPAPANPAYQQLVAQAVLEVQQSSQAAARQANLIQTSPSDWPGLCSAVEALAWTSRQRTGLLFLSQQTGADVTQDVVLSASDTIVSRLADSVSKAIAAAPEARDRKSIGWLLERTTYEMLLQIQSGGKLPPDLASILSVRTGQAGRSAGTLEEVLDNATSQQDMKNRLAAENYIFLEDSSPSARVRAYDWLVGQNLAPAGFDPLAPAKQRRKALDQAEQTASAKPITSN